MNERQPVKTWSFKEGVVYPGPRSESGSRPIVHYGAYSQALHAKAFGHLDFEEGNKLFASRDYEKYYTYMAGVDVTTPWNGVSVYSTPIWLNTSQGRIHTTSYLCGAMQQHPEEIIAHSHEFEEVFSLGFSLEGFQSGMVFFDINCDDSDINPRIMININDVYKKDINMKDYTRELLLIALLCGYKNALQLYDYHEQIVATRGCERRDDFFEDKKIVAEKLIPLEVIEFRM